MQRKRPLRRQAEIEHLLWLRLRALSAQGWQFRKAAPFRSFTLPFVAHDSLLVVELETAKAGRSIVRDRLLREAGYTILRFPREDAIRNLTTVVGMIQAVLEDHR